MLYRLSRLLLVTALALANSASAQRQTPEDLQQSQRLSAREAWHSRGRQLPFANSARLRNRALVQKLGNRSTRAANAIGVGASWTPVGPFALPSDASGSGLQDYGWVSGRVTAIAIDPNDPSGNTVYAGAAYGGVWKSSNAGAISPNPSQVSWSPLTDGQTTLAVGAIAVQPQQSNANPNSSVILVGTGETNSSADSYYGLGILRSADGGQTWTLVPQDATGTHSFAGLGFSKIAFSSSNPNVVAAAAASASEGILEGLENPVAQNRNMYSSSDAGKSWTMSTLTDAGVSISPASVTSVVYNAAAAKFYAAVRFHGFYSSSDAITWTRLPAQPGTALSKTLCPAQTSPASACAIYRGEIAVVPNRAGPSGMGEMYVWYVDANDVDQGIWKTLDGGASWTQVNDSGISNCGDLFGGCGTAQAKYNLALAAVPNGTATDLYAGAVNLYKCTITNAFPACNGSGNNTFMNLTHVYGCSDIARVHPDQHAIDFLVSNGTALLYIANDGGVYRTLDGFSNLRNGTCGLSNQLDNLNASLGPITQFVSISESSSNPDLVFGGTQDNGAPATNYLQSGGPWVNANAGDNGFTAINPGNDSEWFVGVPPNSISGTNILRCGNGISCTTQAFQNGQVVDGTSVGGDTGPFYPPFILDPQQPATLLAGTCRIWRGATSGGAFTLLSPNFETGNTGVCTGGETNTVRALVAGGPPDTSGSSQVIYAGTDGTGPLLAASPQGGRIWVTMSASGGLSNWADKTGTINPLGFPISAVALNPADTTGQTAYAAIMGFHTSHVWQTANGGGSWSDFSANLPDAPVNSIVVDPGSATGNGTLYVGTDVGVFASSTGFPNWTEVGPPATQPGLLPNVAVTSLQIFNFGGLKRLRAATYGRGIWEWNLVTTPDFQLAITNNPQTAFAGQSATFNGTIWARNGYNSTVNLTCAARTTAPPANCATSPNAVLPSGQGTSFTVSASDTAGDYSFSLKALGTDSVPVTHSFSLTLHVVDFLLAPPAPSSVSVNAGGTTAPVSLSVSAAGAFNGSVNLACAGLPLGANCQFQPSGTVSPTSANPATVTLVVSTTSNTPLGTAQITINASTPGGPTKSQVLSVMVGATPDYALAIASASLTGQVNSPAVFNGTITGMNGYSNSVALSCGVGAPPSCLVNPGNAVPTVSGTPFTITVSSNVAQAYAFNVNAVGSDSAAIAHSVPLTFTSLANQSFDFTMAATPSVQSVAAGQTATYTIDVNPSTGNFPNSVTLSCSGLPALTTCSFAPTQIGAGSGNSVSMFTASTTAPGPSSRTAALIFGLSPLAGIILFRKPKRLQQSVGIGALLLVIVSCGGGLQGNGGGGGSGHPGTPPGTYTLTITATSGSVAHSAQVTLTVTH